MSKPTRQRPDPGQHPGSCFWCKHNSILPAVFALRQQTELSQGEHTNIYTSKNRQTVGERVADALSLQVLAFADVLFLTKNKNLADNW